MKMQPWMWLGLLAACDSNLSALRLNEVVPQNTEAAGGVVDREGSSADWFELFNTSWEPVNLGQLHIEGPDGDVWRMPPGWQLEGRSFVLIFADGTPTDGDALHTPFTLADEGTLTLLDHQDRVIHTVTWPAVIADHSWARERRTRNSWVEDASPTPLEHNDR